MEQAAQQGPEAVRLVGPWLRWAGGKRTLAPRLVAEILATHPRLYVEPFLGGGAVALVMPPELPKILADVNPQLVDCWLCMRNLPAELYKELDDVVATYSNGATGYVKARAEFNKMIGSPRRMWARRSAFFIFLNTRCYNGLWRTNSLGQFNVPYGKLEKPRTFSLDEFLTYQGALRHATIVGDHFAKVLGEEIGRRIGPPLRRGDTKAAKLAMEHVAIYADPPYDGTFDGYAKGGFDTHEQQVLASTLSSAALAGAAVWTTNNDTPLIRELYESWAQVEAIDEQHSIGATGARRGKRGCLLIRAGAAIRGA